MSNNKKLRIADYPKSIARITDQDNVFLGNGFIYKGDLVATCFHVIDGYSENYLFNLEFTISANTIISSKGYVLERHSAESKIDMAFVKLIDGKIPLLEELPVKEYWDNIELDTIKAYGYANLNSNIKGNWAKGEYLGAVTHFGDKFNFSLLQTRFPEAQSGYSGSPAWDTVSGLVIGIIADNYIPQEEMRNRDTTYLTDIKLLNNEYHSYSKLERIKSDLRNNLNDENNQEL